MKQYKDLNNNEKILFNDIEVLFIKSNIHISSFIKVLCIILNKYKKVYQNGLNKEFEGTQQEVLIK